MHTDTNNITQQEAPPFLSLVIPSFNEGKNVFPLYDKIRAALSHIDYECIFVDDGSKDDTFANIKQLAAEYPAVRGLALSRNFGHQTALLAGVSHAQGQVVVMMDGDGQHPPEVIPQLIEAYHKGFDIVNTHRLSTADSGLFKKATSKWFYKIMNKLTDIKIEPASSDFRLMNRKAITAFLQIQEQDRFTRGLVSWIGFNQSIVKFEAPERMHGESKYTLKKMVRFAWDGITSFSSKPLNISFIIGVFTMMLGFLFSIYTIVQFMMGHTVAGWASTILIILFLGGIQLLSIGILGEYLSRVFNEVKNRPHFFIKEEC